jgi:hypothetical protein
VYVLYPQHVVPKSVWTHYGLWPKFDGILPRNRTNVHPIHGCLLYTVLHLLYAILLYAWGYFGRFWATLDYFGLPWAILGPSTLSLYLNTYTELNHCYLYY